MKIGEIKIQLEDTKINGLVGYASCVLNGCLFLNSITIRRRADGSLFLLFPTKKSRSGNIYHLFKPLNEDFMEEIETAILAAFNGGQNGQGTDSGNKA